ncbi:MAG: PDDEXK nuclease domain-containing protein [Clostridia bacterium]|nr:PDDEXK nuclease domain-containing protein [Clostridia bacterium]
MNSNNSNNNEKDEYASLAQEVGRAYERMAVRAAVSMNRDTMQLYWSLGEKMASEETAARHGTHYIGALARRFKEEMPEREFTATGLGYMRRFYLLYRGVQPLDLEGLFCLPWSYHRGIIDRCPGNPDKALYYAALTLSTGMSRKDLMTRMDLSFYETAGRPAAEPRFRLPEYGSPLATELMQDMEDTQATGKRMPRKAREPLKRKLIKLFLLKGLSCSGADMCVRMGERHVCLDLVMYSRELKRSVLVEFVPEAVSAADMETILLHASALDDIRMEGEGETIGLLICRAEDGVHARYVCREPSDLSSLPTEEAIEANLL